MDYDLFNTLHEHHVEKPNMRVLKGVCDEQIKLAPAIVDKKLRSMSKNWGDRLNYLRMEFPRPEETARYMVQTSKGTQARFNLLESTVKMVILIFELDGEEVVKPIWLPFSEDGTIAINGMSYLMHIVMTESAFNCTKREEGALRFKSNHDSTPFRCFSYHYLIDGTPTYQSVVFAELYKNKSVNQDKSKRESEKYPKYKPTMVHYLCTEFGLQGAIKKYLGADVHIEKASEVSILDYPQDTYCIAKPAGIKPRGVGAKITWVPNDLAIVFKREDDSLAMRRFIAGVMFVCDYCYHSLTKTGECEQEGALAWHEDSFNWMLQLSRAYSPYDQTINDRRKDMETHLSVIHIYMDDLIKDEVNDNPHVTREVDTFHDLMMVMIESMPEIVYSKDVGSLFDRRIKTVEFMLDHFFNKIGDITFKFYSTPKDYDKPAEPTNRDLRKAIGLNFNRDAWLRGLDKEISRHKELKQLNSTCPVLPVQISTAMVTQEDVKSSSKHRNIVTDPNFYTHESILTVGSTMRQPKHRPDGRALINSHVQIKEGYKVETDPRLQLLHELVRDDLRHQNELVAPPVVCDPQSTDDRDD